MTETEKLKRPVGLIIVMIWSVLAIISLTATFYLLLKHLIDTTPPLRQLLPTYRFLPVFLIVMELVHLWRFNPKAIYLADLIFGLWNAVILFTMFMNIVVRPTLTQASILRLSLLFVVNLSLIIYLTRHSFLDQCKSLMKLYEDQKREKDKYKQAIKMRKL